VSDRAVKHCATTTRQRSIGAQGAALGTSGDGTEHTSEHGSTPNTRNAVHTTTESRMPSAIRARASEERTELRENVRHVLVVDALVSAHRAEQRAHFVAQACGP
jgi:hypothetical protein